MDLAGLAVAADLDRADLGDLDAVLQGARSEGALLAQGRRSTSA